MSLRESCYSVHLSTATTWRGGENQAWLLARGLLDKHDRVLLLAPPGSPLLERCTAAAIPARSLRIRGEFDLIGAIRLALLLRREQPHILHLHDGHAVIPGKIAAALARVPKLKVVAHRRTVFRLKGRGKYTGFLHRVIAISEAVKQELRRARVPDAAIRVVYSGIDFPTPATPESARAWRSQVGIPPDAFLAVHAAALTSEKRQADMLAALAKANALLTSQEMPRLHLAIAGTGELEGALRAQAQSEHLAGCVHFLGFVRDLSPLWAAAQAALFASEAEGLCTALIEAQGAGVPAIVTRAGGMTEVVEENVTGLIVNVGEVEKLSRALLAFQADEASRGRMGEMARTRARLYFSSIAMIAGIRDVYTELLAT